MKRIYSLISLFLLTSCYSDGCWYTPQMVNCVGESYPAIAHYQKAHSIGKTDSKQRWNDVVSCGATYGDKGLRSAMSKGINEPIDKNMQRKFRQCMKNKGYIRIEQCGLKDSPTDTGKCNI